jgi:hypothetical protein
MHAHIHVHLHTHAKRYTQTHVYIRLQEIHTPTVPTYMHYTHAHICTKIDIHTHVYKHVQKNMCTHLTA